MKFGVEETIVNAIRSHARMDSMSTQTDEAMWIRSHERAHIALWMLWQSLADQLGMSCGAINECRTADENRAFLIKCGIADDVVRNIIMNDEDNWGGY